MPSKQYDEMWIEIQPKLDAFRHVNSIDEARETLEALYAPTGEKQPCEYEQVVIGDVPGEWVRTTESSEDRVVMYLHGGGFALGSARSHRDLIARMANAAGARALGVDYRQPPEHLFPASLEDCVATWRSLLDSGVDPRRAVIAGDSAGGGLAVATLLMIREHGVPQPAAAVLFSPWVDLTQSSPSICDRADIDRMTTPEVLEETSGVYLDGLDNADRTDWRYCPLNADLHGLPRLLIQVGEAEILHDDSRRLADAALEAGVDVELQIYPDMFHVFQLYADRLPEAREALENVRRFLESSDRV